MLYLEIVATIEPWFIEIATSWLTFRLWNNRREFLTHCNPEILMHDTLIRTIFRAIFVALDLVFALVFFIYSCITGVMLINPPLESRKVPASAVLVNARR